MPDLNAHAFATMLLTAGALYLFTRERLSLHLSCLAVLVVLVLGFELFPFGREEGTLRAADFLAGFGNEALITIVLLLILGKGVETSGALRPLSRVLVRIWFFNAPLAMLLTLIVAAFLSAFVNNTPIVVILLPLLIGVAHRTGAAPSKILMPMGFATIVGGMSTTIGTSTNLLVVSVANDLGATNLAMFDFALPAVIAGGVAILYLWAIAPRILPERVPPLTRSTPRIFESIISVTDGSTLADRPLAEIRNLLPENIRIERIVRGENLELVRLPTLSLRTGDRLFVRGPAEDIKEMQNLFGGGFQDDDLLRLPDQMLVEIVVTQESPLRGKDFTEARDAMLGQLILIGALRPGRRTEPLGSDTLSRPLQVGDVLLMQGPRRAIRELQERLHLLVLDRSVHIPRSSKATLAVAIMTGVVIAAALGWMPILASALCGAVLMLFTRCLSLEETGNAVDTRLILVVVTSLALGTALTETGAADFLALGFVNLVRNLPPPIVLSAILLITALLTEIVTNNAIAVIGTPIALVVARELGAPEVPFVLAVLFGANMSYLTPIGYQTNLLVFSAGGYRFSDFFRVGVPLQIILWLTLSVALPTLYF
ncbi:MAG TPA: SLC13 family permease [Gammaproteobacteria bacterium]